MTNYASLSQLICSVGLMASIFLATACFTAKKYTSSPQNHGRKVRYELTQLKPKISADPLPTQTDITIKWIYEDGFEETYNGFRGWDFNDDGQFDLVEELDYSGQVIRRAFDFDRDGLVDKVLPGAEHVRKS
jgi:hypothetical protein